MNLAIDTTVHRRLQAVVWFQTCGNTATPSTTFGCRWVLDRADALQLFVSDAWLDARTRAQGDLTGYLAKYYYAAYGGHWNALAKQSRALLGEAVEPRILAAISSLGLARDVVPSVLTDLNRAILEISYRQLFARAPVFFEHLLEVYEAGRLPCGWEGDLDDWPHGRLIAH